MKYGFKINIQYILSFHNFFSLCYELYTDYPTKIAQAIVLELSQLWHSYYRNKAKTTELIGFTREKAKVQPLIITSLEWVHYKTMPLLSINGGCY